MQTVLCALAILASTDPIALSPGLALRAAKLHLLEHTEFDHPRYWAAFTPAGDWR